ncbi:DUF1284 domain-containing protein [Bacillus methanolicus]|uniref:Iron-sulfur binding protein n=1 Tax=Bacillus methanolicus (strain MGA3 / ATCC 53907) TaxID=796606 RepID=I3E8N8_BACMM|nr:DUF1284 domain-containing protein [Bacillus methanolicus]AIE60128.1 hypothetical protein BMMGA3_08630 [Bacillus methanolicus MGA3]EIJ82859.1 hypothetical protein MGA3_06525 [Bacillus methanolicus MGA3]
MDKMLRGHHLLCVHGFRGMGYSPEFVERMSDIVNDIRNEEKDFSIKVVAALDDACMACPHRGVIKCEADQNSNEHVLSMDEKVIRHLGLEKEKSYLKSMLVSLTAAKVRPEDLDYLCKGCSWLSYGVCKEGIRELKERLKCN